MSRATVILTLLFTLTATIFPYRFSSAKANEQCPCFNSKKLMDLCTAEQSGTLHIDSKEFGPSPGKFKAGGPDGGFRIWLRCDGTRGHANLAIGYAVYGWDRPSSAGTEAGGGLCFAYFDMVHQPRFQDKVIDPKFPIQKLTKGQIGECFAEFVWVKDKLGFKVVDHQ